MIDFANAYLPMLVLRFLIVAVGWLLVITVGGAAIMGMQKIYDRATDRLMRRGMRAARKQGRL